MDHYSSIWFKTIAWPSGHHSKTMVLCRISFPLLVLPFKFCFRILDKTFGFLPAPILVRRTISSFSSLVFFGQHFKTHLKFKFGWGPPQESTELHYKSHHPSDLLCFCFLSWGDKITTWTDHIWCKSCYSYGHVARFCHNKSRGSVYRPVNRSRPTGKPPEVSKQPIKFPPLLLRPCPLCLFIFPKATRKPRSPHIVSSNNHG